MSSFITYFLTRIISGYGSFFCFFKFRRDSFSALFFVLTFNTLSASHLVVGLRDDGLMYYYNPSTASSVIGYANNHGSYNGGSAISISSYKSSIYTLGKVTATGEYRINRSDFSAVNYDASGSLSQTVRTTNIMTNNSAANFVSMAYDGQNFWFLAGNGSVYKNNSTSAEFSFANTTFSGGYDFQSLTLNGGNLLAGATNSEQKRSNILSYNINSGTQSLRLDSGSYNFATGQTTLVAGDEGGGRFYYSRADNQVYDSDGEYLGRPERAFKKVLGMATIEEIEELYWIDEDGKLRKSANVDDLNEPVLATNLRFSELGITTVEVIPEPRHFVLFMSLALMTYLQVIGFRKKRLL